ncbi:hypothetical protein B5F40_06570 [Gordonibacter sp. An230]|uniref:GH25 family lysozyme n=1 Tax=Gordonibacter sp. An230 TaxID=1965592 RepID=UPI000B395B71|nr:GH25 family lysozyme [Gordonibacter sp. An230]OUO90612.1 hypothetical protein B5F40_06570 [Gordonibacter sp. An230]
MALNGIDISDYQQGLDLSQVSCDFMICKATEGTGIVHSTCDPFIQKAKALGKLWGFYHFMNGEDPVAQADYFVANCRGYFGSGVPVLDYEMYGRIGTSGAKKFLDRVLDLTGVRCVVYMSRSVCTEEDWSAIAPNHALWVAQYASNDPTGYQDEPWLPGGGFGAWSTCALHQYTSNGRLPGYNGPLDLDIGYLTPDAWTSIARGGKNEASASAAPSSGTTEPASTHASVTPDSSENLLDLVASVMRGERGDGDERRTSLGKRYDEVQRFIDYVASASASQLADDIERGRFGNGSLRRAVLGERYDEAQGIVNQRAGIGSERVHTVQAGETLSDIAAHYGTSWQVLAQTNGMANPNLIYPGQMIVID